MTTSANHEDDHDSLRLPKRAQLQAEAFGLSTRTPEWLRAGETSPRETAPSVLPSADDTWVVAASRGDGWVLERFAGLLERHSIESEIDRPAGMLRVRRKALRAACHLLSTHRRQLRRSGAAREQRIVDGVLLGLVGPPFVLATTLLLLVLALGTPIGVDDHKLLNAVFVVLLLTVFFIVRAGLAGVRWLTSRPAGFDAAPLRRDDADYPPAP